MKTIAIFELANAIFVGVALIGQFNNKDRTKAARWLRISLLCAMIHLVVDALAYTVAGPDYPFALRYAVNFLAYSMSGIDMIAFIMYCKVFITGKTNVKRVVFQIPLIASGICTLASAALFIAGKLIVYENGTAVAVNDIPLWLRLFEILVMLYTPVVAVRFRKEIGWKAALLLGFYCFTPIISGVIAIFTGVDFSIVIGAVSILLVASVVQAEEQRRSLLGAMPLSNDVLTKANIGMWAFELDEGQPPRMYDDETMHGLVGLEHQVPPEEAYHAWYDNIDKGSYDLVTDAVNKMISGEHAEVQYPWHYPDGRTIMVRCGGVRNYDYRKGIRIEGTHQNVTETLHFDEKERERYRQQEITLVKLRFRADALRFVVENDPDIDSFMDFFGSRMIDVTGCDQVIFRGADGHRVVRNAPGIQDIPQEICSECAFSKVDGEVYGEDGVAVMNDCRKGCRGVSVHPGCPARSSFMQQIVIGGRLTGLLTVHYLKDCHEFSEEETDIIKTVATYLGLFLDRIESKKVELEKLEAESSSRAKTEFLFNMSHDIRTPMNAILGYTDIALNHIGEQERVSDSLRKIKTSGGHLLKLINDILEMSRIEAGRMEIINTPVNIYEVTEGIVNMSEALASSKDITFTARISDLGNPYVYADELHINQVVINLISNAIKYTNPGGKVDYRIEQISGPESGTASYRVTVRDNGIGMSDEFQKHLFESFAREQTATVSRQEGAGLGLAIVKRIVDLTGGSISARSRQGRGTVFTVELPLKVMDDAAIEAFEASRHAAAEVSEDVSLEGRRVLVVEDNEMNREIATEILEEAGLTVETAEDGALAVRKVRERGVDFYDFILMDIQMPVMNGYEATAEIRGLTGGDKIPIIALSANAFKEDVEKSLAAGMNDHVAKPVNVKILFSVLEKYL